MKRLHYGGITINVDDSVQRSDVTAGEGAITIRTQGGGWLTFATGPGIPVALEELPTRSADDSEVVIL